MYASYRAEGQSRASIAANLWRYLLKYALKRRRYPQEDSDWAREAARVLGCLQPCRSPGAELRVGFVGDLMWIRKGWTTFLDDALKARMAGADFWVGNLESPLVPEDKVRGLWPDYLRFASSAHLLKSFRIGERNLFGMLSLANNHVFDQGAQGVDSTRRVLGEEGVESSGLNDEWATRCANGVTVGFYALTYGTNCPAPPGVYANILEPSAACLGKVGCILQQMEDEGVDLKILSVHWGHEFEFLPTRGQRSLARELVKLGADVVAGHHPHVIQPAEVLFVGGHERHLAMPVTPQSCLPGSRERKALVLYSLGNFATEMFTRDVRRGMAMVLGVRKDGRHADWWPAGGFCVDNRRSGPLRPHRTVLSE